MVESPSPQTIGRQVWNALRFMLFGVVGFFVMITFSTCFLFGYYQPDIVISGFFSDVYYEPMCQTFVVSLPLTVAGAFMMLYGVGQWRRWWYLIAFFSIPISHCLFFLMPWMYGYSAECVVPLCISLIVALIVNTLVTLYYSRQSQRHIQERHAMHSVRLLIRSLSITYPITAGLICGLIGLFISFTGYAWVIFTCPNYVCVLVAIMPAPLLYVRRTTGYGLYCIFLVIQYGLALMLIAGITVGLWHGGNAIEVLQKKNVCHRLNPLIAKVEAFHKENGRYPGSMEELHFTNDMLLTVFTNMDVDAEVDWWSRDYHGPIVCMSTNHFVCAVPVRWTSYHTYSRVYRMFTWSSDKPLWRYEEQIQNIDYIGPL